MSLFQRPRPTPLEVTFRKARMSIVFTALFSGVINILMLAGSFYMMQVYDRVLMSRSIPTLVALSAITFTLFAFIGILEFIRTRIMIRIGQLADADLRKPVFHRFVDLAAKKNGTMGSQPLRDLDAIRNFLSSSAPFAIFDMPWVPLYTAVNFMLHPLLGYLTLSSSLLLLMLALLSEVSARRGSKAAAKAIMRSHLLAEEAQTSAEAIRAMGMSQKLGARWMASIAEMVQLSSRAADRASIFSSMAKVLRLVLQSAALGLGAYLAINGEITAGVIIGASIVMARALAPIDLAISQWRQYVSYREAKSRIAVLLKDAPPEENLMMLPEPQGALSVENVAVNPAGASAPILQGISFQLPPASSMGIIGATGSGKSTLARVLVGAWPVAKGAVRLDGAQLDQWPPEQLGRAIGYVPQDIVLLSGTIQDNIARFDEKPDPEAVVNAARLASVHDLILRLPNGYNTRVGTDGGIQLSGGQRQRVALARALYGRPSLLVLDEPNSNLDGEGENALFSALRDARAMGTTVVVIAHRPSAIRSVDYLLYLKDGRQAAFGPKSEVLARVQAERGGGQRSGPAPGLAVVST